MKTQNIQRGLLCVAQITENISLPENMSYLW